MDNNNNNIDHNNTSNYNPPHSSADSSSSSSSINPSNPTNNRDQFLRHLNKLSHKISKPPNSNIAINIPTSSSTHFKNPQLEGATVQPPPPPPPPPPPQQQPPVYNINKSDFRDVVQKLTGSPAHAMSASPPAAQPIAQAPKPASSRLQRIRPPPLMQLSTRPPPLLNCAVNPHSPLPPLPTCHAAAESPISAYMRFLNNSVSNVDSSINRTAQMMPPPLPAAADSSGFCWLPSPKSPSPLLSPNLIFSPTGSGALGFPQLPLSPTMSGVPSPK